MPAFPSSHDAKGRSAMPSGRHNTISHGFPDYVPAMSALAPFNKVCSTDLTGPQGPAQFYFLCSDQKP
jgi:hypothetical protein